ncbi:MAG TPA: hypothetical protein PLJ47_15140, partial [Candidatus Hydrogenedentes bacterium]|nr:hypothetical protein [Candidatus Hydrogenedentota bacterium]
MRTRFHVTPRLVVAFALMMAVLPGAWAFYPLGYFDPLMPGQLVYVKWPLSVLDVDNNGDVSGEGDGVEFNFEVGNEVATDGFDETEAVKMLSGMEEWELVSTAFMAFRRGQNVTDKVELTDDLALIDAFNMVSFLSAAEVAGGETDVTAGSLGVTLAAYSFEDTFITIGNSTIPINGGEFLDVDIVLSGAAREFEAEAGGGLFKSGGVILGGLALGLNWSPLSNFDEDASILAGTNVENRVVALRNFDGTIGERGVTSSMLNDVYFYDEGGGSLTLSGQDLAPDDISGLTFLYPRADVDIFFEVSQRARTQTREGLPSTAINGTWVRAWCDADNNSGTGRVPMFDTLSGLYEDLTNPSFAGHFRVKGLFKQLETTNETTFQATYAMTSSEFLPVVFGGDLRSTYDSTHGASAFGISFDTLFPSEVFNETGNLFGLSAVNQGTPLVFDLLTRKIVSQTSGKTLDIILATGRPMFGDQDQTCPLNVIVTPIDGGDTALASIRSMRDNVLLQTAVGAAIADLYYRLAPGAAKSLLDNATALAFAQHAYRSLVWIVNHAEMLLVITGLALLASLMRRRAGRARALASAAFLFAAVLFLAAPANAQMLPYNLQDYLAVSDLVVVGKVSNTESRWIENNTRIVTDTVVEVETCIKGEQNAGGRVHIQHPTGRVGAFARTSQQIPNFTVGEEVLLFLSKEPNGYFVYGGIAGKYLVAPHPRTGEKYVFPTSMPGHVRFEHEAKKMQAAEKGDAIVSEPGKREYMPVNFEQRTLVKLDDFVKHLREVEREQRKRTLTAKKAE